MDQLDDERLLASAIKFLRDGNEGEAADILLDCRLRVYNSGDTSYGGDETYYAVHVEIHGPRAAYDAINDREHPHHQAIRNAIAAVLPPDRYIKHLTPHAEIVEIAPDWREKMLEAAARRRPAPARRPVTYENVSLIRSGGFATVYRVRVGAQEWALKRLDEGVGTKERDRFRQEIHTQGELTHPNIVRVTSARFADGVLEYLMPLADGSLHDEIPAISQDPGRLVLIAAQILDALEYAHAQGVLHRDLKPENVLRFGSRYCLSDFGLCKVPETDASAHTTTSDAWVTGWYASPEQHQGLKYCDARSDVYSMGKLLLHCLCGEKVLTFPQMLDKRWLQLVRRCVKENPDERWQSVADLNRYFKRVFGIDQLGTVQKEDLLAKLDSLSSQGAISKEDIQSVALDLAVVSEDEVLLREVFSSLSITLIKALVTHDGEAAKQFLHAYDNTLGSALSFSYCDVVADQYALFHNATSDLELKEIIWKRLFDIGPDNNRWHVGEVFARLMATLRDPAEIATALAIVESDSSKAAWFEGYTQKADIPQLIRKAMRGGKKE